MQFSMIFPTDIITVVIIVQCDKEITLWHVEVKNFKCVCVQLARVKAATSAIVGITLAGATASP